MTTQSIVDKVLNKNNDFGSCVIAAEQHYAYSIACSQLPFFLLFPTFQTILSMSSIALFLVTMATFLRLKLSRCTIIAANNCQAMVNLNLWLSKSSSLRRQLHGGRGLNSESLACETHTLPLGCHATISAITSLKVLVIR